MIAKIIYNEETRTIVMVYCPDCNGKGHIAGHPLEGKKIIP